MRRGGHRSRGPRARTALSSRRQAGGMERRGKPLPCNLTTDSVVGLSLLAVAIGTINATDVSHRRLLVVVAGVLLIAGGMKSRPGAPRGGGRGGGARLC